MWRVDVSTPLKGLLKSPDVRGVADSYGTTTLGRISAVSSVSTMILLHRGHVPGIFLRLVNGTRNSRNRRTRNCRTRNRRTRDRYMSILRLLGFTRSKAAKKGFQAVFRQGISPALVGFSRHGAPRTLSRLNVSRRNLRSGILLCSESRGKRQEKTSREKKAFEHFRSPQNGKTEGGEGCFQRLGAGGTLPKLRKKGKAISTAFRRFSRRFLARFLQRPKTVEAVCEKSTKNSRIHTEKFFVAVTMIMKDFGFRLENRI